MSDKPTTPTYRAAKELLGTLTVEELLELHSAAWSTARAKGRQAPAMTLAEDGGGCPALRCPHCEEVMPGVRDIDVSVRWTMADRMTEHPRYGYVLKANYGHYADYEGSVYQCESCDRAVTLPRGVSISPF